MGIEASLIGISVEEIEAEEICLDDFPVEDWEDEEKLYQATEAWVREITKDICFLRKQVG